MFLSLTQRVRISDLKVELEVAKQQAEQWEQAFKRLKDRHDAVVAQELNDSEFVCDFGAMNAFSIERISKDDHPRTVIGYKVVDCDGKEQVKEWTLYCSVSRHNQLAAEFRKYVKDAK